MSLLVLLSGASGPVTGDIEYPLPGIQDDFYNALYGGGSLSYELKGIQDDLTSAISGGPTNTIFYDLVKLDGDMDGSWIIYADLDMPLPKLSGDMRVGNGPYIEGELPIFNIEPSTESVITGTNNAVFLEGDLVKLSGSFTCGGNIQIELPIIDALLTVKTPVIAQVTGSVQIITGSMVTGGNIDSNLFTISGTVSGYHEVLGTLGSVATLPYISGHLDSSVPLTGEIEADLPSICGVLTGHPDISSSLVGTLGAAIAGQMQTYTGVNARLTGDCEILKGNITAKLSTNADITGEFPIPSGCLEGLDGFDYGILRHVRGEVR